MDVDLEVVSKLIDNFSHFETEVLKDASIGLPTLKYNIGRKIYKIDSFSGYSEVIYLFWVCSHNKLNSRGIISMLKNKYLNLFVRISIFSVGLIVSLITLFSKEQLPNHLFLVPLIYSIFILILPNFTKPMFENIGLFALNISMLIRYLVSPLLISYEGITYSKSMIPSQESFYMATNLMLYEMIIIFIVFQLTHKKFYFVNCDIKGDIKAKINIVGWLFIIFCLSLAFIYPEIISRYTFIFTADELKSKTLETEVISTIPLLFQLAILVLTISLVNIIYKRYKKMERYSYVLLTMVIVLLTSSFIMGTSRFSVVLPLAIGFYMMFILFKKYRKFISIASITAVLFVIVLSSVLKTETLSTPNSLNGGPVNNLSDNLQLYFSGVNNVAIAVETNKIYPHFDFDSIGADVSRSVVLVNSFFQSDKSALTDFNITFYSGGAARDQILPIIGQGYLYFGFLLSPVLSLTILLMLMYFDSKVMKINSLYLRYIYAYIALKYGLFMMTNFTNLLSFFTNNFLILLVLFKVNDILISTKKGVSKYEHR